MTGWRLGAAIGPQEIIDVIAKLNVNDESCTNHFVQYGALEGADRRPERRRARSCASSRSAATSPSSCSTRSPACAASRPEATFYLFPNVTGLDGAQGPRPTTTSSAARRWSRRASASAPGCTSAARCPARGALRALRLLGHHHRPDPRRPRQAQGVGAVSGDVEQRPGRLLRTPLPRAARRPPAPGWSTSAAGRCRCSTRRGIIAEHLATRERRRPLRRLAHGPLRRSRGPGALPFLQHVLTNNAAALDLRQAQYTIVPTRPAAPSTTPTSTASSRASTCWSSTPSNRDKDWDHFQEHLARLPRRRAERRRPARSRCSRCRGRASREILARPHRGRRPARAAAQRAERRDAAAAGDGRSSRCASAAPATPASRLLRALRGRRATGRRSGTRWSRRAPRPSASAPATRCAWRPACRSTATSSASTRTGDEIPIFSCPLATFAVSFSPLKGDFVGRAALERQQRGLRAHPAARLLAARRPAAARPAGGRHRPRHRPRGRAGRLDGDGAARVGWVTSGTAVPYWDVEGEGLCSLADRRARAALDRPRLRRQPHRRGRRGRGRRPRQARAGAGRPVPPAQRRPALRAADRLGPRAAARRELAARRGAARRPLRLLDEAIANHEWRQQRVHQPDPVAR